MNKFKLYIFAVFISAVSLLNTAFATPKLETVPYVNLEKYLGTWYEIAKIPTFFQKKCLASKAEYSIGKKGHLQVKNTCNLVKEPTKSESAKGRARVMDKTSNAKLRVSFSPILPKFFEGDYWIIKLEEEDSQYNLVVVGHPTYKYLWVLARNPEISSFQYEEVLDFISSVGYDLTKIVKSPTWVNN